MKFCAVLIASLFAFSPHTLFANTTGHGVVDAIEERHPQAPEKGSADLEAVRTQIQRMNDIVDGKKKNENGPASDGVLFLETRQALVDEFVKKFLKALDKGNVETILQNLLIENESYTNSEHKEVFFKDGVDLFAALKTPEEKMQASYEYTRARQALRLKLFRDLAAKMDKQSDPRAILIAEAIRRLETVSQKSYEEATARIDKNKLDRPICFTCGEQVSDDPDYDFYTVMHEAAKQVADAMHLQPKESGGPVARPFFDPNHRYYTYDGKTFHDVKDGKRDYHIGKKGPNNTVTFAAGDDEPRSMNPNDRFEKTLSELSTEFKNSNGRPQSFSPSAAGAPSSNPQTPVSTPAGIPEEVTDFLRASRGQNLAELYPTADSMARALRLVSETGESYLQHKNRHQDPASAEYGVRILWDVIGRQSDEEQQRVLGILKAVARGSITDYKVVRPNNQGYCLWCNVNNDPTSRSKIFSNQI